MKAFALGVLLSAVVFGGAAQAEVYHFNLFQPQSTDLPSYSFAIDTDVAPTGFNDVSFEYSGVAVTGHTPSGPSAFSGDFTFYDGSPGVGGGLDADLPSSATSFVGPVLFTGSTDAPKFLTGTFQFGDDGADTLTISAAPEPGAWALMILGLGGVGAALRGRRRTVASAA